MPQDFDDKIDRTIADYRQQEEEALASVLASARYNIPYGNRNTFSLFGEATWNRYDRLDFEDRWREPGGDSGFSFLLGAEVRF